MRWLSGLALAALLACTTAGAAYTHKCMTIDELHASVQYDMDGDFDPRENNANGSRDARAAAATVEALDALDVLGWELYVISPDGVYWFRKSR